MKIMKKWFYLILLVCLTSALQSETASAAGEQISVNGINILQASDQTVPCGNGTAKYHPDTKTLTLENAVIDKDSTGNSLIRGIQIQGEGITIELIGKNEIHGHLGIEAYNPIKIKGLSDSSLTFHISQNKGLPFLSSTGIFVEGGGLTVEDANLQFIFGDIGDATGYAIDICGKDNQISNSRIEITNKTGFGKDPKKQGINATGAVSLVISDHSTVLMKDIDGGIGAYAANVKVSDSEFSVTANQYAISCMNLEILDKSKIHASVEKGVALQADRNVVISEGSVSTDSKEGNGLMCYNLEIKNSSTVTANGYYPGLFAVSSAVIENSTVEAGATGDVGIFSRDTIKIENSEVKATDSILARGDISITGGKTEIGGGKISSDKNIYIGGLITSNGTPSYDKIEGGTSGKIEFLKADYSAVDEMIKKANALSKDDYTNFDLVEDAVNAVVEGKAFWEQDVVDGYAAAIKTAIKALQPISGTQNEYKIIEGADQTIIISRDEGITIMADGSFDKFVDVLMDGNVIAEKNYTAVSGSTIITLKPEYINTLSAGVHTLTINYTDGMAETTLTLKEEDSRPTEGEQNPPQNPPTGDDQNSSKNPSAGNNQNPSQNTAAGKTDAKGVYPKTGDQLLIGWIVALVVSFIVLLSVGKYKRKTF